MDSTDQFDTSPLLEENSLQEDTTEYTGDGSICARGNPASKKHTGQWKVCSFALVCSFCSYLAYSSIAKNLVSYLTKVLHETNVVAARNVSTWQGSSFLAPLVGAFVADSYLGKYWTALISFTILIVGMMILVLSATLPLTSTILIVLPAWTDTNSFQHIIFFVGLYMVAVGYGVQSPCVTSFGADQFDDTDGEEKTEKSSFFNWHHFTVNAGALISGTVLVWIQDHKASFQSVEVITVLALVPTYERILVPILRKFTGMANGITPLQRIGMGLFFSTLSMVSAALVESNRLQIAQAKGLVHQNVAVPMSILWQGPQYFLVGVSEVFSLIGLSEFFYEESPDAMRSLCVGFYLADISAGGYLSSFIVSLVPVFTARRDSPV
ncbi:hypothetical protein PR202_gb19149 [Eleusine coracana subsp. coracana]|uniref:Uncharacterized protein n=1 Tax=Eleusine coracana subsp. coracana TaxID=191504 RepID=A0AAV5F6V8_ELECO|nr:hypothetical protein PR202_gb19149 [Eleusine coracana subsp. coracana]